MSQKDISKDIKLNHMEVLFGNLQIFEISTPAFHQDSFPNTNKFS